MKRTNLVNKSVKLLLSVIIASSVVAMGSNGTVAATLTNNDAIISNIVMAAETTPLPKQWSTAEVYKDARYGETWSGEMAGGIYTRWEWLNDKQYCFSVEHVTTKNGTALDYQQLLPVDMTQGGSEDSYYVATDNNEPIRKWFAIRSLGFPENEQDTIINSMSNIIGTYQTNPVYSDVGLNFLDYQEDELTCRFTFNVTKSNPSYNTTEKGFVSVIQNKNTGEFYQVTYTEQTSYYDETRALTVIFSCTPTQK